MTNQKVLDLYNQLSSLKYLKGVKFNYAIVKNISILETEVNIFNKTIEFIEDFKKYDTERVELAKEFAKKDDKGQAMIVNNQYVLEDKVAFDKALDKIKEKHKEALEDRDKKIKEFEKLLLEENNIVLHKIKIEEVPEDITTEQMAIVFNIIDEE